MSSTRISAGGPQPTQRLVSKGSRAQRPADDAARKPIGSGRFLIEIVKMLRPEWLRLASIGVAIVVRTVFIVGLPFGYQLIFDSVMTDADVDLLWKIAAAMAGGYALATVADLGMAYQACVVGARAVETLRLALYHHMQALSERYFSDTSVGDVMARFSSDVVAIDRIVTFSLYQIVLWALTLVSGLVALFVLEWRLALLTLLILPLAALGPEWVAPRANRAGYRRRQEEARLAGLIHESVRGHAVISAFGLESRFAGQYAAALDRWRACAIHSNVLAASVRISSNLAVLFLQITVFTVGAYLAIEGHVSPGALVGFLVLLLNVGKAATTLTVQLPDVIHGTAGYQRVREFFEVRPDVVDTGAPERFERVRGCVRFDAVSFGYTPDSTSLEGVDLTIPAGASAAVVGRSGSGKSALLKLVTRTFDPTVGRIELDGRDLRSMSLQSLRAAMGVVSQDNHLFDIPLRENIRLGRIDATDAEVEQAAALAEIHDVIMRFPDGYDTLTRESGSRLTAGQRQRIALARVISRDPQLVVLDDPASALDPATEAEINKTIERLGADRTVVAATHRLSSAAAFDRIFVLDEGRLVEAGSHRELMAQAGVYADMWSKQSGFSVQSDGSHAAVDPTRLGRLAFFEALDAASLAALAGRFSSVTFGPGEVLIREGDIGDTFFVLVRGRVEISLEGTGPIGVREDGDIFGEVALLEDVRRTATATALTHTLCLTLNRIDFESTLARQPALYARVVELGRQRLARVTSLKAGEEPERSVAHETPAGLTEAR